MKIVEPKTYLIGRTQMTSGMYDYLRDTDNQEFTNASYREQRARGTQFSDAEVLTSFYAKLCYKSLTPGKNENISKTRGIEDNLKGVLAHKHGSVLEHSVFNFVTTNCSRVFTHELVRHRVGTAFSQTSGRYVRSDELEMVLDDPILKKYKINLWLDEIASALEDDYLQLTNAIPWDDMDFAEKKKVTSALRRILPNGQANEIGWSANVRALRHMLIMRTSPHAEWEIRKVFSQVYELMRNECPILLSDLEAVKGDDGLWEVAQI